MTKSSSAVDTIDPCIALDEELKFQKEMFLQYNAGNAHCFLLHFNVYDYVFTESLANNENYQAKRLRDYLGTLLSSRGFDVVIHYSLTSGFTYHEEGMRQKLEDIIPPKIRKIKRDYGQVNRKDSARSGAESQVALSYLHRIMTWKSKERPTNVDGLELRIGIILDYMEEIAPHEDSLLRSPEANFNIQMLHRLTLEHQLRRRHLIIGLTSDLGKVASRLYSAGGEWRTYQVPLPIEKNRPSRPGEQLQQQRTCWLKWVTKSMDNPLKMQGSIDSIEELASQTSGFSFDNLRDLIYYAIQAQEPITKEVVHRQKREVIASESRDLLEIVEPKYGFDMVAGYPYIKKYLNLIKRAIDNQGKDTSIAAIIPKGIMMLGPPGTGKSFMASSLAKETGFNMVRFKNIRNRFVGQTERNLNRVLDLLKAMYPVIVFVDEVDAALGQRGSVSGGGGGAGVERRFLQRILEFMASDENRGRVLWIAASNRPDLVDAALISRFDMVMPFLLPDNDARLAMLVDAFPQKIGYKLNKESDDRLKQCIEESKGFTGRELDTICRRALMLSGAEKLKEDTKEETGEANKLTVNINHVWAALKDFRQARDPAMYELQAMLAIQATNFCEFLPRPEQLPKKILSQDEENIDPEKLSNYILELSHRVRGID